MFDNITVFENDRNVLFHPSTFLVQYQLSNVNVLLHEHFYHPICEVTTKLNNFISKAKTHTLRFLNEDRSMMCRNDLMIQKYMTKINDMIGLVEINGDVFINDVCIVINMSRYKPPQHENSFACSLPTSIDSNKINAFACVLPDMKNMVLFPTRNKHQQNAFDLGDKAFKCYNFIFTIIEA